MDRATTTPTTSFAYSRGGDYTARVQVLDFRGGAGTGTVNVHVTTAPHIGTLPKRGTKGRVRFPCELRRTLHDHGEADAVEEARQAARPQEEAHSRHRSGPTLAAGSSKQLTVKLSRRAKRAIPGTTAGA